MAEPISPKCKCLTDDPTYVRELTCPIHGAEAFIQADLGPGATADSAGWPEGPGSWCIYGYNGPPVAIRIYENIIDAVKSMESGDQICWWPDGADLLDAIREWKSPIKE